jgi:hypothetical protein
MSSFPTLPLVPAKAGTQVQPERFVGFIWIPAFAGISGEEDQPGFDPS